MGSIRIALGLGRVLLALGFAATSALTWLLLAESAAGMVTQLTVAPLP